MSRSIVLWSLLLFSLSVSALPLTQEGHIKAAMRKIGHELLLNAGDDTSRIFPVVLENSRYKIAFESNFQLETDKLVAIVGDVVEKYDLAQSYLVDVEECESHDLIYSYEVTEIQELNTIPCQGRNQPNTCFAVYFTILEPGSTITAYQTKSPDQASTGLMNATNFYWAGVALFFVTLFFFFKKNKTAYGNNDNLFYIGEYCFDKRNMELTFRGQKVDLTSKEADLLFLLYSSANSTLERDVIIKTVWGDVGDYVGRTLDVFISKLRKKLEEDATVKIVNVRGIGYKLVAPDARTT